MPDLVELRIAWHEEHISGNAVLKHSLTCDAIIAQWEEDPWNVRLNDAILNSWKAMEQIHDTLLNQDVDWLLVQSEMHQSQSTELFNLNVTASIFA